MLFGQLTMPTCQAIPPFMVALPDAGIPIAFYDEDIGSSHRMKCSATMVVLVVSGDYHHERTLYAE